MLNLLQLLQLILNTYLSDKEHSSVVMLWVSLARGVKVLLPRAEVPQGHAAIAGDLWANLLILHNQHLHHDQVHIVLYAGVFVKLGYHRHQGQDVVLLRRGDRGGMGFSQTDLQ